MAKIKKKNRRVVVQAVEYLVSGGAYFWSGYIMFAFLYGNAEHTWPSPHWNLWWSTIISNLFGWTVNFILQRYWVFKNPHLKGKLARVTGRYLFITLVDFGLNYLILYGLKQVGITPYIGQFISSGFFTVWNYVWYRWWVFPERLPAPRHPARRNVRPHHMN